MSNRKALSKAEIEAMLDQLQSKYSRKPASPSLEDFEQQNPEFAEYKGQINAYCKEQHGVTALSYLKQLGLVSKDRRYNVVPPEAMPARGGFSRPDDDVVALFEEGVAPRSGLFDDCGEGVTFDLFECNLNTQQMDGCIKAFGMLRIGDYVELEAHGPWSVRASFCGKTLGYIEDAVSVEHGLTSKIRYAESWGLLGGRVYAQVVGFRAVKRRNAKKKSPQAALFVTCAMDPSRQNVVDGVLLSADSKRLIALSEGDRENVIVPEGVEDIVDWAFYERGVSNVVLPASLRAIGQEAFARTRIKRVEIPCGVEKIGLRAFVRGYNKNNQGEYDPRRWEDDGPVRYEVADANECFGSIDGSLIEISARKRVLRSVYYDCPCSDVKKVLVPEGVTVLGEGCLVSYSAAAIGRETYRGVAVEIPDGVKRIEDGWSCTYSVERVTLPSTPVKMSKKVKDDLRFVLKTR